jgi:hypothetical protein
VARASAQRPANKETTRSEKARRRRSFGHCFRRCASVCYAVAPFTTGGKKHISATGSSQKEFGPLLRRTRSPLRVAPLAPGRYSGTGEPTTVARLEQAAAGVSMHTPYLRDRVRPVIACSVLGAMLPNAALTLRTLSSKQDATVPHVDTYRVPSMSRSMDQIQLGNGLHSGLSTQPPHVTLCAFLWCRP